MRSRWSNFSGAIVCEPAVITFPRSDEEVAQVVRDAAAQGRRARVVGTGHSSTPVVGTNDVLVSLDRLSGLVSHRSEERRATVYAGTKLDAATGMLLGLGLALPNQGDVDVQSVGGVIGTGSHGTGIQLQNISSRVSAVRAVDGRGELIDIDASTPELLRAARVSVGALGIFTAVEFDLVPAYKLKERVWGAPIDRCLDELADHVAKNRNFEFFWGPREDGAMMKSLNIIEDGPIGTPTEGERVGWSPNIYPSVREQKFHEMEYAVPAQDGPECFRRVRQRMQERHSEVTWPVEYRTLAADDAPLSPAYRRDTVTISLHQDARLPYREFFDDIEAIFREYRGRPHWGKWNSLGRDRLRDLYPEWDAFCALRQQSDPGGVFLNDYLGALFRS
jgi:FAD/FMN-containing dehydrogenase